jgi:hypothetical protein
MSANEAKLQNVAGDLERKDGAVRFINARHGTLDVAGFGASLALQVLLLEMFATGAATKSFVHADNCFLVVILVRRYRNVSMDTAAEVCAPRPPSSSRC